MNLDCQQVRELMDSYLSEELSVETNHGFLRHVAERLQPRDVGGECRHQHPLAGVALHLLE